MYVLRCRTGAKRRKPKANIFSAANSNHSGTVINDLVSRTGNKLANTPLEQGKVRSKLTVADIRRTIETMLARERVPLEVRAQLQSQGLSGVQFRHYDRHDYMQEKAETLKISQKVLFDHNSQLSKSSSLNQT